MLQPNDDRLAALGALARGTEQAVQDLLRADLVDPHLGGLSDDADVVVGVGHRFFDDPVHQGLQVGAPDVQLDRTCGQPLGIGDVGDQVVQPPGVSGELLDQLRLVLLVLLVLQELRDPVDLRDRLLGVERELLHERRGPSTILDRYLNHSVLLVARDGVGRLLFARLAQGIGHLVHPEIAFDDLQTVAGRDQIRLQLLHAILGRDQLLGLTGEALLGHLEQLVDLSTALVVGQLELAPCLEVLEAAVELRVLRGSVLELTHQLLGPRLLGRTVTIGLHRDVLGLGVAEPLGFELGPHLLDCSVRSGQVLLQRREGASHLVGLLARLADRRGALLDLGRVTLELAADPGDLVVRLEELLLAAGGLGTRGRDLVAHGLHIVYGRARRRFGVGDPAVQFRLALFQLAAVGRFDLLELTLELLARRPDLLLQLGLTLHEIGTMRGLPALELGLRGPELVLEHRRSLLLVAERAELGVCILQLTLRGDELRSRGGEGVSDLHHLHVRRVKLFLGAGGGPGRCPHRGELAPRRVELLLRHVELGVQADRFQFGFAQAQILLVVVDDPQPFLDRFLELRREPLALVRDGP